MIKSDNYQNLENVAHIFKAFAHPARLAILQYISQSDCCVNIELTDQLPIGRTTVNQHLEILKKANLLKWHHEGTRTFYCLNHETLKKNRVDLDSYFNQIDNNLIIECN